MSFEILKGQLALKGDGNKKAEQKQSRLSPAKQ
jgi:hypothetical protein